MTTSSRSKTTAAGAASLALMSMAAVPCLPLQAAWLLEAPAFHSGEAKVVRAAVLMLERAWRSIPAGTLPVNHTVLAPMLGLDEHEMGQHFSLLTEGWTLSDGRLVHPGMHAAAARIWLSQGESLDALAAKAAVVVQDPDAFELVPTDAVSASPLQGRRRLPASFGLTPDLRAWLAKDLGVPDEQDQDFILGKFVAHARSRNEKYADPEAGFKVFASRENLRFLPSRQRGAEATAGGLIERMSRRYGNAGESATNKNRETLERVLREREHAPAMRGA